MVSVGYSARQIALHWIVFVLVAFQYFTGGDMTHLFRAAHGGRPTDVGSIWAPVHIAVGIAILASMLWRLMLRRTVGAPRRKLAGLLPVTRTSISPLSSMSESSLSAGA